MKVRATAARFYGPAPACFSLSLSRVRFSSLPPLPPHLTLLRFAQQPRASPQHALAALPRSPGAGDERGALPRRHLAETKSSDVTGERSQVRGGLDPDAANGERRRRQTAQRQPGRSSGNLPKAPSALFGGVGVVLTDSPASLPHR